MGSTTFETVEKGQSAKQAFGTARERARRKHIILGYTGTIAEKYEFVMIDLPHGKNPMEYAVELIEASDERIRYKRGPAGCIQIAPGEYLFFGWASE